MFTFNQKKTMQAVGVLFREHNSSGISYIRVLKLLYIADRECLQDTGSMITGDKVVAMANGPVLSRVYNLIKGEAVGVEEWSRHFCTDHYHLKMHQPLDIGELSKFEIEKLRDVAKRHEDDDDWQVVERTHDFEEWQKNRPIDHSSRPISIADMLKALGREKDLAAVEHFHKDDQIYTQTFLSSKGLSRIFDDVPSSHL